MSSRIADLKLVVVGDGGVGKSSLLITYATGEFSIEYVRFDEYTANMVVGRQQCSLGLWDTLAQEDYDRMRPLSYPNTNVFLLCYSLVYKGHYSSSYDNVEQLWYPELQHHCPNVPIILVGTKLDLRDDKEQESRTGSSLSMEDGLKMQRKIGSIVKYMECSSLTGQGVNEVFEEAARIALKYKQRNTPQKRCVLL